MRSIGFFWKDHKDKRQVNNCESCPYKIDDAVNPKVDEHPNVDNSFVLQINLWNTRVKKVAGKNSMIFKAIDFGIVCPLSTSEIAILFPFKIVQNDFQDLVKCLSIDTDLLCTVFNEDLKSISEPDKSYHAIECEKFKYLMYELSNDNIAEIKYDCQTDTTLVVLKINSNFDTSIFKDYKLFLRFRIKMHDFKCFALKKEISNDWLQAAFSSSYMFDIRVNDVRELSKKKKEFVEFEGFRLPVFSKIHFFYMADSEETVENGSSLKLDSRLLENSRWHSYLGNGLEFTSTNIAHHWKKSSKMILRPKNINLNDSQGKIGFELYRPEIMDFSLFFKTEFSEPRRKRIMLYLFIIILLGIISSSIVSVTEYFTHKVLAWISIIFVSFAVLSLCLIRKHLGR
jgi:hypothetical protein